MARELGFSEFQTKPRGGQGVLGGNRRMEFPFIVLKDDRKILGGVDQAVRCYRFDIRVHKSVFEEQECLLESRWI